MKEITLNQPVENNDLDFVIIGKLSNHLMGLIQGKQPVYIDIKQSILDELPYLSSHTASLFVSGLLLTVSQRFNEWRLYTGSDHPTFLIFPEELGQSAEAVLNACFQKLNIICQTTSLYAPRIGVLHSGSEISENCCVITSDYVNDFISEILEECYSQFYYEYFSTIFRENPDLDSIVFDMPVVQFSPALSAFIEAFSNAVEGLNGKISCKFGSNINKEDSDEFANILQSITDGDRIEIIPKMISIPSASP